MGELRRGYVPAGIWVTAALLCAPWLAGCSSTGATAPAGTVQTAAAEPRPRWVDVEEDGREPQVPPPRRERLDQDDPTEPFSPNYGSAPARAATAPHPVPYDVSPGFARRLASADAP
jgi:hypothetical protein